MKNRVTGPLDNRHQKASKALKAQRKKTRRAIQLYNGALLLAPGVAVGARCPVDETTFGDTAKVTHSHTHTLTRSLARSHTHSLVTLPRSMQA
jgi:hypothetical protein